MVLDMRDNITKEKNMVKVNFIGQIIHLMKESSQIIIYMVKIFINGVMAVYSMVNGKIIKWRVQEYLVGLMVENILVAT